MTFAAQALPFVHSKKLTWVYASTHAGFSENAAIFMVTTANSRHCESRVDIEQAKSYHLACARFAFGII